MVRYELRKEGESLNKTFTSISNDYIKGEHKLDSKKLFLFLIPICVRIIICLVCMCEWDILYYKQIRIIVKLLSYWTSIFQRKV